MSKQVVYTGTSDFQGFDKKDFEKADVTDQGKVTFAQGEPTEVSDAAAEALLSKKGIFGDHSFDEPKDEEKAEAEVETDGNAAPPSSGPEATTEGTAVPGAAGNVGRGSTGRGTST